MAVLYPNPELQNRFAVSEASGSVCNLKKGEVR